MLKDNQKNNSVTSPTQQIVALQSLGASHCIKGQHDKSLNVFLHTPVLPPHDDNRTTKRKSPNKSSPSSECKHYVNYVDIENNAMHRAKANHHVNKKQQPTTTSSSITKKNKKNILISSYNTTVLPMIEYHFLQQYLLQSFFFSSFLQDNNDNNNNDTNSKTSSFPPIVALIYLIGLDLSADFLIKYTSLSTSTMNTQDETNNFLPIDIVCKQLKKISPKLLYWYLHILFVCRDEIYTNFSSIYTPPKIILDLHYDHLKLFLDYSADIYVNDHDNAVDVVVNDSGEKKKKRNLKRSSSDFIVNSMNDDSPFLTFLKVSIHLYRYIFIINFLTM